MNVRISVPHGGVFIWTVRQATSGGIRSTSIACSVHSQSWTWGERIVRNPLGTATGSMVLTGEACSFDLLGTVASQWTRSPKEPGSRHATMEGDFANKPLVLTMFPSPSTTSPRPRLPHQPHSLPPPLALLPPSLCRHLLYPLRTWSPMASGDVEPSRGEG